MHYSHREREREVICLFPKFGGIWFCSAVLNASKTHHYLTYIGLGVCVSVCLNEDVFPFVCAHTCYWVHALREKQLIIKFNRRNTVYPERYKTSERETERW